MKKSAIIVLLILVVIATLPVIGNSFMSKTIDERLTQLESFGLETTSNEHNSTYLNTTRHFEFLLKDSQKFINYIKQYSDAQIPPYINAMLDGVLLGADIEYSNLPFAKAVTIEIYPLSLSHEMRAYIGERDLQFSTYIDKFLHTRGILYHINYNLLNDDFDGYVKDIKQNYKLSDGLELDVTLQKATFKGNGELIAPNQLSSRVKRLEIGAIKGAREVNIILNKFTSKSNFESQSTYITSAEFKNIELLINGTAQDLNVTIDDVNVNGSSNDQGDKAELNSKISIKKVYFTSSDRVFNLKDLSLDIAVNALDKKSYEELRILISKNSNLNSPVSQREIQNSMFNLLQKGLVFEIADFSLKNINTDRLGDLNGFDIKSKFTFKVDPTLKQKIEISPLLALAGMNVNTNIKISKEIYTELLKNQSMLASLTKYAKVVGNNYIFDISLIDSKIVLNGKALN